METIKDIKQNFGTLYYPKSALVFYENIGTMNEVYVEHFDMDRQGNPINAHPLTVREANALAKALHTEKEANSAFLKPKGILPTHILSINPNRENSSVVWYTKGQQRQLFFVDGLEIPNGKAHVPPMLWKASKQSLSVYALKTDRRPKESTLLHYAPFLNIYNDGKVCMGTVTVDIKNSASVEEFTNAWENYFFNSYFSHLLGTQSPVKGNCVHLWKELIQTDKVFPKEVLKPNNRTVKNLLS